MTADTDTAAAPVLSEQDPVIEELPPIVMGSPLQKLGSRLADLLDDDQFNNIEPWLSAIAKQLAASPALSSDDEEPNYPGMAHDFERAKAQVKELRALLRKARDHRLGECKPQCDCEYCTITKCIDEALKGTP